MLRWTLCGRQIIKSREWWKRLMSGKEEQGMMKLLMSGKEEQKIMKKIKIDILRRSLPLTITNSKCWKKGKSSRSYQRLFTFMGQKLHHTTTRVTKIPKEVLTTLTEALGNVCAWEPKYLSIRPWDIWELKEWLYNWFPEWIKSGCKVNRWWVKC